MPAQTPSSDKAETSQMRIPRVPVRSMRNAFWSAQQALVSTKAWSADWIEQASDASCR